MIQTIKEQEVLIDAADWDQVKHITWFLGGGHSGTDYVMGHEGDELVYLHRVLMKPPKGFVVDHINRNRYDNQRTNLRVVDYLTSNLNRGLNRNNTSGVKGVSWHKQKDRWRAHIMVNHRQLHLGLFAVFEQAVEARELAEKQHWPSLERQAA